MENERQNILSKLRQVIDPDLYENIVDLRFVKNLTYNVEEGLICFTLQLTSPACPMKTFFLENCKKKCFLIPWVRDVNITFTTIEKNNSTIETDKQEYLVKALKNVRYVIGVISCKGGVGKSTIAMNLASMLQMAGTKVGLLDADVFGPSMAHLLPNTEDIRIKCAYNDETESYSFLPIEMIGCKFMSYAYITKTDKENRDASQLRGPIASSIVMQLLAQTLWGELDYLVIDFPPGTSDVVISLLDEKTRLLDAAVCVSTPQDLSVQDSIKGLDMLKKSGVPIAAVVENMAYLECEFCCKENKVFANSSTDILCSLADHAAKFCVPIYGPLAFSSFRKNPRTNEIIPILKKFEAVNSSDGPLLFPFCRAYSSDQNNSTWVAFKQLTDHVIREVSRLKFAKRRFFNVKLLDDFTIQLSYENKSDLMGDNEYVSASNTVTVSAPCWWLRHMCSCFECTQERLKEQSYIDPATREEEKKTIASEIVRLNDYTVLFKWSDSHESVYSFVNLERQCRSYEEKIALLRRRCDSPSPNMDW